MLEQWQYERARVFVPGGDRQENHWGFHDALIASSVQMQARSNILSITTSLGLRSGKVLIDETQ